MPLDSRQTHSLLWVTGARGLIGSYIAAQGRDKSSWISVEALTREHLDLTDYATVRAKFQQSRPAGIIHCAALSKSPACQANPALARKLNVEVTAFLAELAAESYFLFFSTDLVFDGASGNYDEGAPVNPLSVYAETKAEAERIVLGNRKHAVIRTSLNGGISPTRDRGFNEEMRRAWAAGQMLRLFVDEFRCPIAAEVTARATWELVEKRTAGLFHVAGSEKLSRWEIGQLLSRRWTDVAARLQPASLRDYQGAPRSPDTSLNCDRVQQLLSFRLPGFSRWLRDNPDNPF
jgi:dTDP-4-dehydrorhamnose reductase